MGRSPLSAGALVAALLVTSLGGPARAEQITVTVDAGSDAGPMSKWFEPSVFATHAPTQMTQEFLADSGGATTGMVRLGVGFELGLSISLNDYIQRLNASAVNQKIQAVTNAGGQVVLGISKTPYWISPYSNPTEKVCSDWYKYQTYAPGPDTWDDWGRVVYETVKHFNVDQGLTNIIYEFWAEPNHGCFWNDTQANFLEMWKQTVLNAEHADPQVRMAGPTVSAPGAKMAGQANYLLLDWMAYSESEGLDFYAVSFHDFGVPPVAFESHLQVVASWLGDHGYAGRPILITEYNPRDGILADPSWPTPPSALMRRVDSEMGASYVLSAMKYMEASGVDGFQSMAHICNFNYESEYPAGAWGARTHYVNNGIRKAIYHGLVIAGGMKRQRVDTAVVESDSTDEYFPHFHAMAGAEDRTLTVLMWNYVAVPFYQVAYALLEIGYGNDDLLAWGWEATLRQFFEGQIPVSEVTLDPVEQDDLLWAKRYYERQQALVTEQHDVTLEAPDFFPDHGLRLTRYLVDSTHSNSYYHYTASGLQAAIDNQYLEVVDQRHLDHLGEVGSIAAQPYSVTLVVAEVDTVAKVTDLTWPAGDTTGFGWEAVDGATVYDVVRGNLRRLQLDAGFASTAVFSCGQAGTTVVDPTTPPAGNGYYYLARGRSGADTGSWGSAQRNAEIAACP